MKYGIRSMRNPVSSTGSIGWPSRGTMTAFDVVDRAVEEQADCLLAPDAERGQAGREQLADLMMTPFVRIKQGF